jgi:site-specific DNA recombinase
VAIDPARAPLIRQAFELYATGDYSLDRLTQTMADLGLRSRPTKRFPAKPVSLEQLRQILANPYYTGVLVYQGVLYPGRHPAIVDQALFERAQEVADLRSRRGSRDHIHQHFLKGMLFCGRCQKAGREHRLILTEARGRSGYYFYFLCRGRQEGECDLPYLRVEQVEDAVEREYATLALPADFAEQVEERVAETIADEQQSTRLLRTNLGAELQRLNAAEERLIDLAAEGTLPAGKVRSRLTKLQQDRERVSGQLETVEHDLAEGASALMTALRLLDKPQQLFQEAGDTTRRLLTQTFFERIYIDDDDVTEVRYQRPFGDLHAAGRIWLASAGEGRRTGRRQAKSPDTRGAEALQGGWADLLASVSLDTGSSKTVLVDLRGLEPPTATRPCCSGDVVPRLFGRLIPGNLSNSLPSLSSSVERGDVTALSGPVLVLAGAAGALAEALGHAVAEQWKGVSVPFLHQLGTGGVLRCPTQHRQHRQLAGDVRVAGPAGRDHLSGPPRVLVIDPGDDVVAPAPHGRAEFAAAAGRLPGALQVRRGTGSGRSPAVTSPHVLQELECVQDRERGRRERQNDHLDHSSGHEVSGGP